MTNTINLKDFHPEGSGSTMSVNFKYLKNHTIDWIDGKTNDYWMEGNSQEKAKRNIVNSIIEFFEHELEYSSVDKISLKKFCEQENKKLEKKLKNLSINI